MAKVDFEGFEDFEKVLDSLAEPQEVQAICKMTLYDGAGAAAAEIVEGIRTHKTHRNPVDGMTPQEQKALLKGFGISRMEERDGDLNVKIGFAGYDETRKTKKHKNGVPIPLTANSLRKGTSWRAKDDFMAKGMRDARKKAPEAMEKRLDEELAKRLKKGA